MKKIFKIETKRIEDEERPRCFGIMASAEVGTSHDGKTWLLQRIHSGGLYGIDVRHDAAFLREVEDEEREGLRDVLAELGFPDDEVNRMLRS